MNDREFAERIIRTADEYYFTAEAEWEAAGTIEPADEETLFEFRRHIRNALLFHIRSLLMIDMIETDDDQSFEDLLEIVLERETLFAELVEKNDATAVLDEESDAEYSRLFSVGEAMRSFLLQTSAARAAALPYRMLNGTSPSTIRFAGEDAEDVSDPDAGDPGDEIDGNPETDSTT